jgi:hypothetical protein
VLSDTDLARQEIKLHLEAYMTRQGLSPEQVAAEIDTWKPRIDPTARRPHLVSHDTIRRFLRGEAITFSRLRVVHRFLVLVREIPDDHVSRAYGNADITFDAMKEYFGITDDRVGECDTLLSGTYEFYAVSEDLRSPGKKYVVRGALRLWQDESSGALLVSEKQERHPTKRQKGHAPVAREDWSGYFFMRKDRVVLVLRAWEMLPKFYILEKRHYGESGGDEPATTMHGVMLKIGSGGGVFHSKVYMRRNDEAFDHCDVVREGQIDAFILGYLE